MFHPILQPVITLWAIVTVTVAATGCAVTPSEVKREAEARQALATRAQASIAAVNAPRFAPAFERVKGNYLGTVTAESQQSTPLPPGVRDMAVNNGARTGTLEDVATEVRRWTGIAVRISSDVVDRGRPLMAGASSSPATASGASGAGATDLPTGPLPSGAMPAALPLASAVTAPSSTEPSSKTPATGGRLPLSWSGDLADYLSAVASALNIHWDYNGTEIQFRRRITRAFSVAQLADVLTVRDELSASASAQGGGGAGAGAGSGSSGSFGANSNIQATGTYNAWVQIENMIKAAISTDGRYSLNPATGTVVVTDSRDVVERVGEMLAQENAILSRQVVIEVRTITVQLNRTSQAGVDLNMIYQSINKASGATDWSFRLGSPGTLTDGSAGSVSFNIARPDVALAGSTIAAQALNQFGNIVADSTRTIVATNRVPAGTQDVTERAYLAQTTPASGGVAGAAGTPGLTPGVVSYGDNLVVVPNIGDDEAVTLRLFYGRSALLELGKASAGSGASLQSITTPVIARNKNSQSVVLARGETLVMAASNSENLSSNENASITGGSRNALSVRTVSVLLITPRILARV